MAQTVCQIASSTGLFAPDAGLGSETRGLKGTSCAAGDFLRRLKKAPHESGLPGELCDALPIFEREDVHYDGTHL